MKFAVSYCLLLLVGWGACEKTGLNVVQIARLQLVSAKVGAVELQTSDFTKNTGVPTDQPIAINFSRPLDAATVSAGGVLIRLGDSPVEIDLTFTDNNKTILAKPKQILAPNTRYSIFLGTGISGAEGEQFPGHVIEFTTGAERLSIISLKFNDKPVDVQDIVQDVPFTGLTIEVSFSNPLDPQRVNAQNIRILGPGDPTVSFALADANKKLTISVNKPLVHFTRHSLFLSDQLRAASGQVFSLYTRNFYTSIDPFPKFPVISDEALLTLVQRQTFKYFWDFAHPVSGLARERNTSGDVVTSGGSGFGIMAIIVGISRGFVTRTEGINRLKKMISFLETADRFHGVWPHWMNGSSGKVIPFSPKDDGADLVETSFLIQGLIALRQFLDPAVATEKDLIDRINTLWHAVEWDWHRRGGQNVLYWHWSPIYQWDMNFALSGYFEEQITYFLAAASPTHSIPKIVYTNGYGKNGAIVKNNKHYGYVLPLESPAPLFWVQYSYLGLNSHFSDDFADYWTQNVNATYINQAYCIANPKHFIGYSADCWGLTSSDNQAGYSAHSPANDLGVITPTAALSSMPYTPTESMKALKFFYYTIGDKTWGQYGFYDAFNTTEGWYANSYLAIDQGPIVVMIENYRTGLLWELFMSAPEVTQGREVLGFK